MADLGAIQTNASVSTASIPAKGVCGTVSTPDSMAVPLFRCRIALYRRSTAQIVRISYTDSAGNYVVASAKTIENEPHFVVALDSDLGTPVNALIFDRVLPVALP